MDRPLCPMYTLPLSQGILYMPGVLNPGASLVLCKVFTVWPKNVLITGDICIFCVALCFYLYIN